MSEELLKQHNINKDMHLCECSYKDFRLTMKTPSADLVQVFFTAADNMLDLLVPDTEDCEVHE